MTCLRRMVSSAVLSSLLSSPVRVSLSILAKASLVGAKSVTGESSANVSSVMLAAWTAATRLENFSSPARVLMMVAEPVGETVTGLAVL